MANETLRFLRINTQATIYFSLTLPSVTGAPADTFLNATAAGASFAAGDCKVSIDGAASANTTNLPTDETEGWYSLVLTAAELNGANICITLKDQTDPRVWEDKLILIQTSLNLGSVVVDNPSGSALSLTSSGSNGHGMVLAGNGTGEGLSATGGATGHGAEFIGGATSGNGLQATATNGNSHGVSGTGQGSGSGARYTGGATGDGSRHVGGATSGFGLAARATAAAEITDIWEVIPSASPTAAPGNLPSLKQMLQYLMKRFYNKVTQTTTTQTVFQDDSVAVMTTMAVSNDGTTQSKNKAA